MFGPYKCDSCEEIFDEPRRVIERHGFNDGFYETFYCCPNCGGSYHELEDDLDEEVDED